MFDSAEEEGTKAAALWVHMADATARQQAGKEFLRQVTG
jgi:hypothetical protein